MIVEASELRALRRAYLLRDLPEDPETVAWGERVGLGNLGIATAVQLFNSSPPASGAEAELRDPPGPITSPVKGKAEP